MIIKFLFYSLILFLLLLFYYSCPNFSPFDLLCPAHLPHSHSHSQSPHLCPCPWVNHTCSFKSQFSFFLPLSPKPLPSGHCQSVPCFHTSGSILLIGLFCSLDSSYKWDHMVFSFNSWLKSPSIIFSNSIHAVTKGRSFIFLSAV